jgi:hypothetical protein
MKGIKYKEPKSLLEIRAIKRKLSREVERIGFAEFHKRSEVIGKELRDRIEKARQEKLVGKR